MKNKITKLVFALFVIFPFMAQADIVSLSSPIANPPAPIPSPLSCFNFTTSLKTGSKSYAVRGLQYALIHEGYTISPSEYGTFGTDTLAAVNQFQTAHGITANGMVGKMTNAKLNASYGCDMKGSVATNPVKYPEGCTASTAFSTTTGLSCAVSATSSTIPSKIALSVKSVVLDSSGATATFCNNSPTDIPAFPVRLRLNGIIRDFDAVEALKAGSCNTETIPYSTWGLTYDPSTTFGLVTSIDPNGMYKTSQLTYPSIGAATLTIPAVAGAHLAIRGLYLKSNGVQATLCNLGDTDLPTYPVHVTVNGTSKDFDVASAHAHGQCPVVVWPYDTFGLPTLPSSGTAITASVNVDPNNTYKESNEFDNSAVIVGNL